MLSDPESVFHHKKLIHMEVQLFFAGREASSPTLHYGFLLLKNPDLLGKLGVWCVGAERDQVL